MEFFLSGFLVSLICIVSIPTVMAGKVTSPKNVPKNAILLSKVESLTLRAGKMTTSRRVSAVPQLSCIGPKKVCELYNVEVMRCTNEGADYDAENIQWACRADVPEDFKLGSTDVACEGYASNEDPYVLKGSCGVEYRLLLTEKGEAKYGMQNSHGHGDSWDNNTTSTLATIIFFAIFLSVLFIIIRRITHAARRNPPRLGGGNGQPPWYGGGGNGNDDPPPPYDYHDNPSPPRKQRTYGNASGTGAASSSRTNGGQQNQGWRPGPWTAGLAGATIGFALGRNQNQRRDQPRPALRQPSGGFFGGGGGSRTASGSSSPPSVSSSRYESTGFGNTSRR